jgi:hypothetical protein
MALVADRGAVLAADDRLRITVQAGETLRARLALPRPPGVAARPIVALSRRFAVVALPWSSEFAVFPVRGGNCQPIAIGRLHSRPITALAVCHRRIASAAADCTVRVWRITEELVQVRMLAKAAQPATFVRACERLREAVSVSRDGFVMALSLRDGRYLRGFKLPFPDPSDVVVSDGGFVAICFNGPDSHIVVVLDQNLKFVVKKGFDGCVQCWATCEYAGIEHLVVGMRNGGVKLVMLPMLEEERAVATVRAQLITCAKGECFVASAEGTVTAFTIRGTREGKV